MRVLIVDDDLPSLKLLQRNLSRWDYDVLSASNGKEALEVLESDPTLSVLITDWEMPKMDGLELCRHVRSISRDIYLHIIMVTSRDRQQDLLAGMDAGADAFMSKPFNPSELHAHLRVVERILSLEKGLESRLAELDRAHRELRSELEAAGEIQRSLLPDHPPSLPGVHAAWSFESLGATMGDMLNVVRLDERRIGMYCLDVSGHGCQAALLSVSLSRVLNPYHQQGGILKRLVPGGKGYRVPMPAEVAKELNDRFPVMKQSGQFFTFIYGILDLQKLTFRYMRAGHPPMLCHVSGKIVELEDEPDMPIGILADSEYAEHEIQLSRGDLVLFYTDGVEEARSKDKEEYGRERLVDLLNSKSRWDVEDALALIRKDLRAFASDKRTDDSSIVGFSLES